jgi:hypothetical protein
VANLARGRNAAEVMATIRDLGERGTALSAKATTP